MGLPTTTVKKERKKMNGVIYYLLTSFTAKKNKAKSTKQTLSRLSQTGHQFVCRQVQRSQHFLNFSSKHHFYQLSCKRLQNFDEIFVKSNTKKKQQQVHRDEGKNGRRNTTTTTTKKNTNVIIIVYAASLFFDKFRV